MEENSRTVMVGDCTIHLGDDDVFYITIIGEVDEEIAIRFMNTFEEIYKKFGKKKRCVFVDNNNAGKISSKARKVFSKLEYEENTDKVAIFGLHAVAKVLATFFMGITQKREIRFFNNKEEALLWLKGEKE